MAPHGYVRYAHGCRCDVCREGKRMYIWMHSQGARRTESAAPFVKMFRALYDAGYTSVDIAKHTGVSPRTILNLIHGERTRLQLRTADKLRKALDLLPREAP